MERHEIWRNRPVAIAGAVCLVLVAAFGFLVTRAGLIDVKYAAMNPIRDPSTLKRIASGNTGGDEALEYLTRGSEMASETLYVPPTAMLRAMSLGHRTALADIMFVRAHSYFLSHFFADRIFDWLDNYYEAIVGLDPDNSKVYLWAGQVVKYGQHIDDVTIRRANAFLEDGIARFPNEWRLHMDLGFNLFFEFRGETEAERSQARLKARDHFAIAAGLPGAPIDPNFVAELFQRGREEGLALAYALQKYYEATDDQKKQLLRRIGAISEVLAEGIQAEEARWKEEYPFVPVAMFSLMGISHGSASRADVLRAILSGVARD